MKIDFKCVVIVTLLLSTFSKETSCRDVCATQLCDCKENRADCKNKNITEISDVLTFPNYITNIDLSANNIQSLRTLNIDIKSDSLELLDISSNAIKIIENSTFESFNTPLLALNLRNNLINIINEDTFFQIPNLVRLDLSYNQISNLPEGVFDAVGFLQHLDLSFNPIKILEETLFMNLKSLKVLNLSFLQLDLIKPEIFDWNLTITDLDLSSNYFTTVPSEAIWYLRKTLQKFQFSGNLLQEIGSESFAGLSQLKVLILEQQLYLKRIDQYAFGHLMNLETFVLRYAPRIQRIPSKAFHINTANQTSDLRCPIRDLTLEFTTLTTIPEDLLDWDKVRYVNFRNNRWMCDCHFKWIKETSVEEITNYSIICYGPIQNRGKNTKTLKEEQFTCEVLVITSRSGAVALLGIIVFAMIISFTTVLVLVYRRNGWLWNPPKVAYDKIDSPLNTITIFDRSVESLAGTDERQRNSVYIHDG